MSHAAVPFDRMCLVGSVGHKGKFGHEFLEFEFRPDGKLRYANNSNYKNDVMIRKEGKSGDVVSSVPLGGKVILRSLREPMRDGRAEEAHRG